MAEELLGPCLENRELSWLSFNLRVLEEAQSPENPLLERLKFAAIYKNNLSEFFMVRVGALEDRMLISPTVPDSKTGLLPQQELLAVLKSCRSGWRRCGQVVEALESQLRQKGIYRLEGESLITGTHKKLKKEFDREVLPILSPQVIDDRHPFPHIANGQLHVAVLLEKKDKKGKPQKPQKQGKQKRILGIIPVPKKPNRIWLTGDSGSYILLEELLLFCCEELFSGFTILERQVFAISRSADIDPDEWLPDEEQFEDYRVHMQKVLKKRSRLSPVRLLTSGRTGSALCELLCETMGLGKERCFSSRLPLDMSYVFTLERLLPDSIPKGELCFPPHQPVEPKLGKEGLIKLVNRQDVLLSYPYESMKPFLNLIREAGRDKAVVSIKITLYRIAAFSELALSLIEAAENGKEVLVLIELRARFDEENNIHWADRLEEAGCRVIYGPDGFKTHAKLCLITRQERTGLRYITQVGTGNYNENTAKLYTDLCLITADQEIGADAAHVFLTLSLGTIEGGYTALWVAPEEFSTRIIGKIDREIAKVRGGGRGRIILKCNAITDLSIIKKLIEASGAGVTVDLLVRGICCVRPGVPGLTDNITVVSIVGRFLEHSRIYSFGEGEDREIFISSGDLMTRSTMRRVEIACPVRDRSIRERISRMLDTMLHDNQKARLAAPDGSYQRRVLLGARLDSQLILSEEAVRHASQRTALVTLNSTALKIRQKTPDDLSATGGFFQRCGEGLKLVAAKIADAGHRFIGWCGRLFHRG